MSCQRRDPTCLAVNGAANSDNLLEVALGVPLPDLGSRPPGRLSASTGRGISSPCKESSNVTSKAKVVRLDGCSKAHIPAVAGIASKILTKEHLRMEQQEIQVLPVGHQSLCRE